jgi:hypothetical protein
VQAHGWPLDPRRLRPVGDEPWHGEEAPAMVNVGLAQGDVDAQAAGAPRRAWASLIFPDGDARAFSFCVGARFDQTWP